MICGVERDRRVERADRVDEVHLHHLELDVRRGREDVRRLARAVTALVASGLAAAGPSTTGADRYPRSTKYGCLNQPESTMRHPHALAR